MFRTNLAILVILLTTQLKSQKETQAIVNYSFNNGETNHKKDGQNLKVEGASYVEDRFGNEKSSVYLHGNSSSYLNLGTSSRLKPIKGSISLWVNVDLIMLKGTGFDYNPILITKSHAGDDFYEGYFIGLNYNTKRLNVTTSKDSLNQITLNSTHPLSLRDWHHIVMTYDDDHLALYLDNKLEAKLPKKFRSVFLEADSVIIGNSANQKNERYFCGSVDDISFYDKVLSLEEISELYNSPDPNRYRTYSKWIIQFIALILIISLIVWFITNRYKDTLKKENEKNKLNARLNELENKAIRSQMNPHFMFNSLNTLQRFILESDVDNAHLYLTKFSRLLRKMLESSTTDSISIAEEISILNDYIELEKLRLDNSFEYEIVNEIAEPNKVHIPIMLVQPFVENAIWHGLMSKKENRKLKISFRSIDKIRIQCCIEDNGVGREISLRKKDPFKKKSLATEFIRQRLELLEKSLNVICSLEIIDNKNELGQGIGTTVIVVIPKVNSI